MIIYDLIFDLLKENGFDVYAPDSHIGDCINSYIVVKQQAGQKYLKYSTQVVFYDILCYAKNYTDCLKLKESVKEKMKLIDSVKPTFNETEAFYDESVKCYMASVEYRNYRKIEN